jgi:hypothetical protein
MPWEQSGDMMRNGTTMAALLGLALALGGCGGSMFGSSSLDLFNTSSKATTEGSAAGVGGDSNASTADIECPSVDVRTGAATLLIGSKPGGGEPSPLEVRYQGSIIRTARECHVNAGVMTIKVGIEGRVITGPAGGPGTVEVPLRLAVVHEGVTPKAIMSKLARIPVTIAGTVDRVTFTHIDSDISFPLPRPLADIDAYVVYVGFDPAGATPEKKSPVKKKPGVKQKPKPKTTAKPKQS